MNILTIIPAKLGSTRLPRKNILPLGGRPLLEWTIQSALDAGCCGEVMVSTESEEVAAIARRAGVLVPFMRPDYLSHDPYQAYEVCEHVLDEYEKAGKRFDTLILLLPTSPFRSPEDIRRTLALYRREGVTAGISASLFSADIYSAHSLGEGGAITPIFPEMFRAPAHERPAPYELNGAVTIVSVDVFRKQRSFCGDHPAAYVMDWPRCLDIDNREDLEYAAYLLDKGVIG
ncbi:MAG: acylneuraminate cytidylyltransferase family protein [Pseudodesulfovibrio sp.]